MIVRQQEIMQVRTLIGSDFFYVVCHWLARSLAHYTAQQWGEGDTYAYGGTGIYT